MSQPTREYGKPQDVAGKILLRHNHPACDVPFIHKLSVHPRYKALHIFCCHIVASTLGSHVIQKGKLFRRIIQYHLFHIKRDRRNRRHFTALFFCLHRLQGILEYTISECFPLPAPGRLLLTDEGHILHGSGMERAESTHKDQSQEKHSLRFHRNPRNL